MFWNVRFVFAERKQVENKEKQVDKTSGQNKCIKQVEKTSGENKWRKQVENVVIVLRVGISRG
jgi:hypothetical protein